MKNQKEFEEYQKNEGNLKNHPMVLGWDVLAERAPLDSFFWKKFWMDLTYESSLQGVHLLPEVSRGNFSLRSFKGNDRLEELVGFCNENTLKKLQISDPIAFSRWFLKGGAGCLLSQGRVDDLEFFLEKFESPPYFYSDKNPSFISNFIYHAEKLSEDEKQRVIDMFPSLTDLRVGHPLLTNWIINEDNFDNCVYLASQTKVKEMEKQYVKSSLAFFAFEATAAYAISECDLKGFKKLLKVANEPSCIRKNSQLIHLALKNVLTYFTQENGKVDLPKGKKALSLKEVTQIFDLIYDKSQSLKVDFPVSLLEGDVKEFTNWFVAHAPNTIFNGAPSEVVSAIEAGSLKDKYINENKNDKRKAKVL